MVYSLFHPEKPAVFSLSSKTDLAENAKIDILWSRFCKKNTSDWDLFSLYSASFDVPNLSLGGARTEFLFNLTYHHLQTMDIHKEQRYFLWNETKTRSHYKSRSLNDFRRFIYYIFYLKSKSNILHLEWMNKYSLFLKNINLISYDFFKL